MRSHTTTLIRLAVLFTFPTLCLFAQKVETQSHDQKSVLRVETTPDHLTVIELIDPVTMVAVGNQDAFMIERRDNKVFVKPTEDGAKTNLFIWTSAGRYSYELVPAADIERMHFAIDQAPPPFVASLAALPPPPPPPPPPSKRTPEVGPLRDMLTRAIPISVLGRREQSDRIQVTIRSLYRQGTRLYLQYALTNGTGHPYQPASPIVWHLTALQSRRSLIPLEDVQLGEKINKSLRVQAASPIGVLESGQAPQVVPGDIGLGWLEIEEPQVAGPPLVLELQFAPDAKGMVSAFLVLKHPSAASDATAR